MKLRPLAGKLHLVLGLSTGLVFSLVCLTGAFVAFTQEALDIVNRKHLRVGPEAAQPASIDRAVADYRAAYPEDKVIVFNAYRDPARTYDLFSAVLKPGKEDEGVGYKMAYVHHYSGKILHVDHWTLEIIVWSLILHTTLMLGDFGQELIRWCTWLFFFQLAAGLILWWPPSLRALGAALRWQLKDGAKRRLFDSHRVTGFYSSAGLIVMVVTALIMSWTLLSKPLVALFGGDPSQMLANGEKEVHPRRKPGPEFPLDSLAARVFAQEPGASQVTFIMPDHDTVGTIDVRTHTKTSFVNFAVGKSMRYDRVTGEVATGARAEGRARNAKVEAAVLLVHMGFWGGTPTQILYFIVGMAGASLPLTGFLLWRGKRRRKAVANQGASGGASSIETGLIQPDSVGDEVARSTPHQSP